MQGGQFAAFVAWPSLRQREMFMRNRPRAGASSAAGIVRRQKMRLNSLMNRRRFLSATTAATVFALAGSTQAEEKKLRVGIIGHTGRGDYGHGLDTMWMSLPETEIVGVADPDPNGLEGARKKLKGTRGFADYREMLSQ